MEVATKTYQGRQLLSPRTKKPGGKRQEFFNVTRLLQNVNVPGSLNCKISEFIMECVLGGKV